MTTCPRAWEVEAARDGRLTGRARETLDAHVQTCASCARDAQALEALAAGLRGLGGGDRDDVKLRRLRHRVLDAVDAEQTGRVPSGRVGRPRAVMAALAVAMVLGVVASATWRAREPRADVAAPRAQPSLVPAQPTQPTQPTQPAQAVSPAVVSEGTRVDVSAAEGARYTRTDEADVDRFELADGTLHLRVQRPPGGRRVLVAVPDGEIEDVGTTFDVVVSDGHTQRVSVQEGRVVLRLTDRPSVTIEQGKAWRRSPPAAKAVTATTARLSDGEREDAAYLDVLRLLREGHDGQARTAASRYLHDFPAGFRRTEMERVATGEHPR